MSLRLFVIYLDYRLYSSILFKMEVCGLQEEVDAKCYNVCGIKSLLSAVC
jgi:hypothetical protein